MIDPPSDGVSEKKYEAISNHAYKRSKMTQIFLIGKLDHKPTIHWILTNTPQKELHQIDLQEDRGEHCIEIQRERSHLDKNYGPEGLK